MTYGPSLPDRRPGCERVHPPNDPAVRAPQRSPRRIVRQRPRNDPAVRAPQRSPRRIVRGGRGRGGGSVGARRALVRGHGLVALTQNRHGTSAARLTPTRGPDDTRPGGSPGVSDSAPPAHRSTPSWPRPIPSAWVRQAGPRASDRSATRGPRRSRARSSPSTTRPARSSTADASPVGTAHHVGAPVHAVAEVDVQVARRPEHHRVARGRGRARRARRGRRVRRRPPPRSARPRRRPRRCGAPAGRPSSGAAPPPGAEPAQPVPVRHSPSLAARSRSSASCSRTRGAAVPPRASREATDPRR